MHKANLTAVVFLINVLEDNYRNHMGLLLTALFYCNIVIGELKNKCIITLLLLHMASNVKTQFIYYYGRSPSSSSVSTL